MRRLLSALCAATLAVGFFTACAGGSSADGSTSWLSVCERSSQCRLGLSCICGKCTRPCDTSRTCKSLGDATCGTPRELGGKCSPNEAANVCVRAASASSASASPADDAPPDSGATTGAGSGDVHDAGVDARGGCEGECARPCTMDADCADGDFCNGVETCMGPPGARTCQSLAPIPDGTACGDDSVCSGGRCRSLASCDLTGNWATKITATVTWGGDPLDDGMGTIEVWSLLSIERRDAMFTAQLKPCGITLPDFHTGASWYDETYGLEFDASVFDSPTVSAATLSGNLDSLTPGASIDLMASPILIGVDGMGPAWTVSTFWPPNWSWLTPMNGYTITDADGDGHPGITSSLKAGPIPGTGTSYQNIIWAQVDELQPDKPGRSGALFMAIRELTSLSGTLDTCLHASGTAQFTYDHHVIGCIADEPSTPCNPDYIDFTLPVYTTKSATFVARVLRGDTCSAVRDSVP